MAINRPMKLHVAKFLVFINKSGSPSINLKQKNLNVFCTERIEKLNTLLETLHNRQNPQTVTLTNNELTRFKKPSKCHSSKKKVEIENSVSPTHAERIFLGDVYFKVHLAMFRTVLLSLIPESKFQVQVRHLERQSSYIPPDLI